MVAKTEAYELASLRQELMLRIFLQNLLLVLSLVLFTVFATVAVLVPATAWLAAFGYACVTLGAVLQWCHHGVRTKQIKAFLLMADADQTELSWERWLPANRPKSFLGSRWMISTKGVFLGLQSAMMILAGMVVSEPGPVPAFGSLVLLVMSAGFLLTNPKE